MISSEFLLLDMLIRFTCVRILNPMMCHPPRFQQPFDMHMAVHGQSPCSREPHHYVFENFPPIYIRMY